CGDASWEQNANSGGESIRPRSSDIHDFCYAQGLQSGSLFRGVSTDLGHSARRHKTVAGKPAGGTRGRKRRHSKQFEIAMTSKVDVVLAVFTQQESPNWKVAAFINATAIKRRLRSAPRRFD